MSGVTFRTGNRVRELAKPFRLGTVIAVQGIGPAARITAALDNWHPQTFAATDLELL